MLELENNKKLTVLYKQINKTPQVIEIDNTLEAKQKLVKGLIEIIPYMDNLLLVCNEEGKIYNMKANVIFPNDYIAGDFFIVGDDNQMDFRSLTKIEIKKVMDDINKRSIKYKENNLAQEIN